MKSVFLCVSESVSESVIQNDLYALHQTCQRGSVSGDMVTYCFLMEMWNTYVHQTRSGVNVYHCSYGKIRLTSNVSKTVTDTMMVSMEIK